MKSCRFHKIKIGGETAAAAAAAADTVAAAADTVAAEEVVKELHRIIEKEGYSLKQIFNIGGTAVV
jgi:hypothetical protein